MDAERVTKEERERHCKELGGHKPRFGGYFPSFRPVLQCRICGAMYRGTKEDEAELFRMAREGVEDPQFEV